MRSTVGVIAIAGTVGLILFGEGSALELGLSGGAGGLAGGNISGAPIGFVGTLSASHTLVDGVDYVLDLQYTQVDVTANSTYVYRSAGLGVRWYPSSHILTPYCIGRVGLFDWRIERDGRTFNPSTGEEMKALSLGLGAGVGCVWQLSPKIGVDLLLLSHFIFSQNPSKFGSDDENEVLFQVQMGLSYHLF